MHVPVAVRDPAGRRLHRDADAVVLADVEHRRRQLLVRRPRGGVEGRLRGGVVAAGVAERADGDRILGDRQRVADAAGLFNGDRRAERLRQMRGDGRGLRQHPQGLAAPDLVAAARGRVVLAGREAQRRIHDRVHARQLAEALGHEAARAVVQEGRIGVARGPRDHRVALVTARTDGVEDLVLHAQHAGHQVEVAADQLRLEQMQEIRGRERGTGQHRGIGGRRGLDRAVPGLHEIAEILVADLGAIEATHAGGDRTGNRGGVDGGHGRGGYRETGIVGAA